MDRKISLGVLFACAGLAGCLHNTIENGGPSVIVPVSGVLDSVPPFGAAIAVPVQMLSADLNGVTSGVATIIFNADQTFTINLASGGSITVDDADIVPGDPQFNADLNTTSATYFVGLNEQVDVHLGEDALGSDLFILARIDDFGAPAPSPMAFVVFGDETATLPTGTATYNGGFISEVFDATGASLSQWSGTSVIDANFGGNSVDVTLSVVGEGAGVIFSGSDLAVTGAQYGGTISSTGGGSAYAGDFNGAFFGPNAEATAGTFNAQDTGTSDQIVGGFTGFQ